MIWQAGDDARIDFNWIDVDGKAGGFGKLDGYGVWDVSGTEMTREGWKYTGTLVGRDAPGGTAEDPPGSWTLEWELVFDGASQRGGAAAGTGELAYFVTASIVITNVDLFDPQPFGLLMELPVVPTQIVSGQGSIVGTVTDLTFDDATVSAPFGSQIYTPLIDDTDVASGILMADPFQAHAGGPMLSGAAGPQAFGGPEFLGDVTEVAETIGIELSFDLTPGDVASFTSIFEITPAASLCLGDCGDNNGFVGTTDLLALLGAWGPNPGHAADLDGDGAVGTADFLVMLSRWGPCP
jgi:hypothetical protein